MAQENCQKIKLLKLYELLQQETDEEHPMTTMTIVHRLGEAGISCDRRTLSKGMAILNEYGYEFMWRKVSKEKGYYVEDRSFSVPELKILIDAVQGPLSSRIRSRQNWLTRLPIWAAATLQTF